MFERAFVDGATARVAAWFDWTSGTNPGDPDVEPGATGRVAAWFRGRRERPLLLTAFLVPIVLLQIRIGAANPPFRGPPEAPHRGGRPAGRSLSTR